MGSYSLNAYCGIGWGFATTFFLSFFREHLYHNQDAHGEANIAYSEAKFYDQ